MSEVQKNVPMPDVRPRAERGYYSERFRQMEVGDSFALPIWDNHVNQRASLAVSAKQAVEGMKITTRKVLEDGVWTLRVWRKE